MASERDTVLEVPEPLAFLPGTGGDREIELE